MTGTGWQCLATAGISAEGKRTFPEQTLLYQIVDEYYPAFAALMAEQGKELPGYVQREFEEFLQSPRRSAGRQSK